MSRTERSVSTRYVTYNYTGCKVECIATCELMCCITGIEGSTTSNVHSSTDTHNMEVSVLVNV